MEYKSLQTPPLIEKCVEKDPLAWAEFVRRFSPLITLAIQKTIFRYFPEKTSAKEEVKDIRQNIFLSLWGKNKLEEIRNRQTINYWLAIAARNATINYLKTGQKEVLISDESFFETIPAKENASHEIKLYRDGLSAKEKIIFKLYFEKNCRMRDISDIIGAPIGTVSSKLSRMREKIKKLKNNAAK